ncbi:hypothetical protein FRB94_009821 [Tulasnella sp. JGI-2019a]|nr:hypothetical protein FRB94_009821 [Tulasnella sp. JGI-2019a]KAG9025810.1 hypothetical protein FRB95_009762 [Tulasnella sp. JGI-2019a]
MIGDDCDEYRDETQRDGEEEKKGSNLDPNITIHIHTDATPKNQWIAGFANSNTKLCQLLRTTFNGFLAGRAPVEVDAVLQITSSLARVVTSSQQCKSTVTTV